MSARVLRHVAAALAALAILPLLEALFFFVISGGEQSVRSGFSPGHVEKYLGIWLSVAWMTTAVVAASGLAVLVVAKLTHHYSASWIVAVSAPTAAIAAMLFLLISGSGPFVAPGIYIIAVLCGALASLAFCVVAGVPWRSQEAS